MEDGNRGQQLLQDLRGHQRITGEARIRFPQRQDSARSALERVPRGIASAAAVPRTLWEALAKFRGIGGRHPWLALAIGVGLGFLFREMNVRRTLD